MGQPNPGAHHEHTNWRASFRREKPQRLRSAKQSDDLDLTLQM